MKIEEIISERIQLSHLLKENISKNASKYFGNVVSSKSLQEMLINYYHALSTKLVRFHLSQAVLSVLFS